MNFLELEYFGNTMHDYAIATAVFVVMAIVLRLLIAFMIGHLSKITKKTENFYDNAAIESLRQVKWFFYVILGLFLGTRYLVIPENLNEIIKGVTTFFVIIQISLSLVAFLDHCLDGQQARNREKEGHKSTALNGLRIIIKLTVWISAFLFLLANFGVNITTLVAGLGVGGIAFALAVQNILEDLLSSVSIYMDKPFEIGDYIVVGEGQGTVRHIGLKTTRIETLHGEELVISNKELTQARIQNFRKMKKRRADFVIGVTYNTDVKQVKNAIKIIKSIFKGIKDCKLDRVHFHEFAESSLNLEIVYYMNTRDYAAYMNTQQKINLAILDKFKKEGIEFAYPTRVVYQK